MITNDRQYRIVKSRIENFQESLEMLFLDSEETKDVHPKILEAEKNAINYQLQQLLSDVKEYDDLKAGNIIITEVRDLKELPLVLIKARIANGLTQLDLAQRLGVKEQQIQKYEAEQYESVSLRTLVRIAEILKINIQADVQIREFESSDLHDVNKYPFKQMLQRKWFPEFSGSLNEAVKRSATLIANLYDRAGVENIQKAFTRKSIRSVSHFSQEALNVWYARIVIKAREQHLDTFFDKNIISGPWLKQLASFSAENEGPKQAVQFLKDNGIRVVFEPQIEGTYLDGAALLVDKIYPVIALTLRYDRLDNFWFVLFHELAHIVLHLGNEFDAIFDDLDSHIEGIEMEADLYALNISIPEPIWKKSLVRFSPSNETIINQARSLKIHPALIAGRIRRETGKYHLFNDLIGQGEIRSKFSSELNN
jgi:HTH-type transcriptional regulator/antitoxin HigA